MIMSSTIPILGPRPGTKLQSSNQNHIALDKVMNIIIFLLNKLHSLHSNSIYDIEQHTTYTCIEVRIYLYLISFRHLDPVTRVWWEVAGIIIIFE